MAKKEVPPRALFVTEAAQKRGVSRQSIQKAIDLYVKTKGKRGLKAKWHYTRWEIDPQVFERYNRLNPPKKH